ncbi:aldehyde dehydrogenase family protein [Pseudarthrobacter oxydans]|uniref:aldehyde dehydrogenase family protein n=1 Tax=Pseudarthrobacter oxydans TaxID=1671 RepID=UPI0038232790
MTTIETTPMTIGGRAYLAADGATIDTINPATSEVIGRLPAASKVDVDHAVEAASRAFETWRRYTPQARAAALNAYADVIAAHADELVDLDVAENGTPIREMRRDGQKAVNQLRYYANIILEARGQTISGEFDRLNYTIQQPYGVVGRIIPFNHPLMFAASKIAAPLAAGNTILLKPSENTSLSALRLGELSRGVLPDGVLNVITGYGADAGDAIVRHPAIRRLAFIGSAATGRAIQAAAASVNVKNVSLELGGKNPLVIFPDADLDNAVRASIRGMNFTWQGQSCGSTSRLLIHRDLYAPFLDRLAAGLEGLTSGLPALEESQIGSIISPEQFEKVKGYIALGKDEGGRLLSGGNVLTDGDFAAGMFVRPTVFADVNPGSRLAREEIFGPVLAAMPFDSYDDAITIANSVGYGLTASVFTQDLGTAHSFARDVEAGYVWVNEVSRHVEGTAFGGVKDSGIGRDEGIEELYSYSQSKNVHVNFS